MRACDLAPPHFHPSGEEPPTLNRAPSHPAGKRNGQLPRIILAENWTLLRQGVALLLAAEGFAVVGQAQGAGELLKQVASEQPDVVIIDIRIPPCAEGGSLWATGEILSKYPRVSILLLSRSLSPNFELCELLSRYPERVGWLVKDRVDDAAELADAVLRIGRGHAVLDPAMVSALVGRRNQSDALSGLSGRERDVMSLMASGCSNQAIATRLFITERTVEKHVNSIFAKLRLSVSAESHRRVLAVLSYLRASKLMLDAGPEDTPNGGERVHIAG